MSQAPSPLAHNDSPKNHGWIKQTAMTSKSIALIGMMGAGKSVVGRKLANKLNFDFVDSDHVIEARAGVSISHIFDVEGEQSFRDRESKIIAELSLQKTTVLATGGGCILREENRRSLRQMACVIYLYAPPEVLYEHVRMDRNRPLLQTKDPQKTLESLFKARHNLYVSTADIMIQNMGGRLNEIVKRVWEAHRDFNASREEKPK